MKHEIQLYAQLCKVLKKHLETNNRKAISKLFSVIIYPKTVISKLVILFYKYIYCSVSPEEAIEYEKMLEEFILNSDTLPNRLSPTELRNVMLYVFSKDKDGKDGGKEL